MLRFARLIVYLKAKNETVPVITCPWQWGAEKHTLKAQAGEGWPLAALCWGAPSLASRSCAPHRLALFVSAVGGECGSRP